MGLKKRLEKLEKVLKTKHNKVYVIFSWEDNVLVCIDGEETLYSKGEWQKKLAGRNDRNSLYIQINIPRPVI